MPILYTNGDSHTAGAEAVNTFAFAADDHRHTALGRKPHPDNLKVAWGTVLAHRLGMAHFTDAESASSNDRIMRTTVDWIEETAGRVDPSDVLMIIQWSTWEREEWQYTDGTYYQVNASGIDDVPEEWQERYKEYVANVDWDEKTELAFQDIFEFHLYLNKLGYKHIFFNGNNSFYTIRDEERYDFGDNYITPYIPDESFDGWLQTNGYNTVITSNYHYSAEAHAAWANHMLQYIKQHEII